jgi:hypothetical protein
LGKEGNKKIDADFSHKPDIQQMSMQSWVPLAHACNPSSGGSKPSWTNSLQDPMSKKKSQKRAGGVAQGVGSEFKPQYCKKKKSTQMKCTISHRNVKWDCLGVRKSVWGECEKRGCEGDKYDQNTLYTEMKQNKETC